MDIDKREFMQQIKDVLRKELTTISYDTWISPLEIRNIEGNHIVFTTVSEFQRDYAENKYKPLILNTLRFLTNKEWTYSVINLEEEESGDDSNGTSKDGKKVEVSPEAAVGGPIALVKEGDMISIDIPANKINVEVSDVEMQSRKAEWQPREPKITTGYLARYASLVTSGNRGAILEIKK